MQRLLAAGQNALIAAQQEICLIPQGAGYKPLSVGIHKFELQRHFRMQCHDLNLQPSFDRVALSAPPHR
jgi:hypothetical protein